MKKVIFIALIVIMVCIFLFSGWKVLRGMWEYHVGEKHYEDMTQYVSVPEPEETKPKKEKPQETSPTEKTEIPETQPEEEDPLIWPEVDFDALRTINPDVIGWIYLPDTQVNYPLLQGDTNDEYLYTLMTGEYNGAGSIFLDADLPSDFSAQNNVIYGHNMINGTMLADFADYRDQSYYEAHPYIMLMTPDANYCVRIFSGYVIDIWGDAWKTFFAGDEFDQWLQERTERSFFEADVVPTTGDHIITFSTCTYESDNARFILHGVLEKHNR